ncbi:MAG: hypothetical protein KDD25_05455 [Bdellovibrionales bacterium]|nr:hypothetical protein [Bdellovibrionales bacterium]
MNKVIIAFATLLISISTFAGKTGLSQQKLLQNEPGVSNVNKTQPVGHDGGGGVPTKILGHDGGGGVPTFIGHDGGGGLPKFIGHDGGGGVTHELAAEIFVDLIRSAPRTDDEIFMKELVKACLVSSKRSDVGEIRTLMANIDDRIQLNGSARYGSDLEPSVTDTLVLVNWIGFQDNFSSLKYEEIYNLGLDLLSVCNN